MREDIHEFHEAEGYARMAERVGKSVSHIFRRLQLLKLDPKLKKFFLDGQMTAAVLRQNSICFKGH